MVVKSQLEVQKCCSFTLAVFISTPQSGQGDQCEAADNAEGTCSPGEGLCAEVENDVDCVKVLDEILPNLGFVVLSYSFKNGQTPQNNVL